MFDNKAKSNTKCMINFLLDNENVYSEIKEVKKISIYFYTVFGLTNFY